jgi:hypothetical protein
MSSANNKSATRVQVAPPVTTSGSSLPEPLRHQMETAFGKDFSDVRVHQGPQATMLGAQAYTSGNDIHFAPGQYNPNSGAGRELLGHELAHVVQQRAGRGSLARGLVQF